jgi:type IV secretion system protein TrbE
MKLMRDNSLATEIPIRSLLDNGLADLRGMGVMVGCHFHGPSPEVNDLADICDRANQLASGIVHLATGDTLQFIAHRIPAPTPPRHTFHHRAAALVEVERYARFDNEQHWLTPCRLYASHHFGTAARTWFEMILGTAYVQPHKRQRELATDYALQRFAAFEDTVSSAVDIPRMTREEMFRALLMDMTYLEHDAAVPDPEVRINQVIGQGAQQINGQMPMMGKYHLRVITISLYPGVTFPQTLAVLLKQPGRMTISARFQCLNSHDAQQNLEDEKQYWNRTGFESLQKLWAKWSGNAQVDAHALEMKADINAALAEATRGAAFGWSKVICIIRDEDSDRATFRAHNTLKELYAMQFVARLETLHTPTAVMESWPGYVLSDKRKKAIRIRTPLISARNFADLILPATHWAGTPYINSEMYPAGTSTPMVVSGSDNDSPFFFPTHVDGVAHIVAIGPTGVGKTTLEAGLICALDSIPDVRMAAFDAGWSSWPIAHLLNADYREIGGDNTPALCPLALLDKPNGEQWLFGWCERIFQRFDYEMDEDDTEELGRALRQAKREGKRTLTELRACINSGQKRMRKILYQYTHYWGHVFDGAPDATTSNRLMFYEIGRLSEMGVQVAAPAMELMLQLITAELNGDPTWIFADEWHRLLSDKVSIRWFQNALRTFRRLNCGFVGFTQSLAELLKNEDAQLLLESFKGKIWLPNAAAKGEFVRNMYRGIGVNEHTITSIASAKPRSEYIYDSEIGTRKFRLDLGDIAKAICGSTGYPDVQRARTILAESPNEFLDAWLRERVPQREPNLHLIAETQVAAGR